MLLVAPREAKQALVLAALVQMAKPQLKVAILNSRHTHINKQKPPNSNTREGHSMSILPSKAKH